MESRSFLISENDECRVNNEEHMDTGVLTIYSQVLIKEMLERAGFIDVSINVIETNIITARLMMPEGG